MLVVTKWLQAMTDKSTEVKRRKITAKNIKSLCTESTVYYLHMTRVGDSVYCTDTLHTQKSFLLINIPPAQLQEAREEHSIYLPAVSPQPTSPQPFLSRASTEVSSHLCSGLSKIPGRPLTVLAPHHQIHPKNLKEEQDPQARNS